MNPSNPYPADSTLEIMLSRLSMGDSINRPTTAVTSGGSSSSATLSSAPSISNTAASSVGRTDLSSRPSVTSARSPVKVQEEVGVVRTESELPAGIVFDFGPAAPYNTVASQAEALAASSKVMAAEELSRGSVVAVLPSRTDAARHGDVDGSRERSVARESGSASEIHLLKSRLEELEYQNNELFTRNAKLTSQMREKDWLIGQLTSERQCMQLAAQNQVVVLRKFQECMNEFQDLVVDISDEYLTELEKGLSVIETLGSKFAWRKHHQVYVHRLYQGFDLTIGKPVFLESVCRKLQAIVGMEQASEESENVSSPVSFVQEERSVDSLTILPISWFNSRPPAKTRDTAGVENEKSFDASEDSFDPDRAKSSQALSSTSSGLSNSFCPDDGGETGYDLQLSPPPLRDEFQQLLKQEYDCGKLGQFGIFAATDDIMHALVPDIVQDIVGQFRSVKERICGQSSVVSPSNAEIISWVKQIEMEPIAFFQAAFEKRKNGLFLDWSGMIPRGSPVDIGGSFIDTFICPKSDFRSFWVIMMAHYLTWDTPTSRAVANYIRD